VLDALAAWPDDAVAQDAAIQAAQESYVESAAT